MIFVHKQEGEVETAATVYSYEDGMPAVAHKTNLTSLNVNIKKQDQVMILLNALFLCFKS